MGYQFQTEYAPSGQNPVYGFPFVRILIADASGKIILPCSGVAIQASTASFVVTPVSPVVQLTDTQPQSVVLTTVGTPAFPSGPNFLYQYNSQAGPNGNGLPYTNQLYVLQNVSLTNAATITSDFGTVNGSASFSQPANSTYVFVFDQVSNWQPNAATAGSGFRYY